VPLDRSHRLTDQSVVMDKPDDIASVFDALRRVPERGFFTKERALNDVAEELGYQLLLRPDWIRPHVAELVRLGAAAAMTFEWQCLLLDGAPDGLVRELIDAARASKDVAAIALVLATRNPVAMKAVAALASERPDVARECRILGFYLPEGMAADPRFTLERKALRLLPDTNPVGAPHAVGLALDEIVVPGEDRIAFHYLSVTPRLVGGMPGWEGQAHSVAPRHWPDWTLVTRSRERGRLQVIALSLGDDRSSDDELADKLDEAARTSQTEAAVAMIPFDDELVYANQHPLATPNVIGIVGGPPMGLAAAPLCPDCGRLMFHLGYTGTQVREYGDGFRSLFICETCRTSATVATLWN
jgi:hypothetical protein